MGEQAAEFDGQVRTCHTQGLANPEAVPPALRATADENI
jgi:hypothetical protein